MLCEKKEIYFFIQKWEANWKIMDRSICEHLKVSEETGEIKQEFIMNTLSYLTLPQGNRLCSREE